MAWMSLEGHIVQKHKSLPYLDSQCGLTATAHAVAEPQGWSAQHCASHSGAVRAVAVQKCWAVMPRATRCTTRWSLVLFCLGHSWAVGEIFFLLFGADARYWIIFSISLVSFFREFAGRRPPPYAHLPIMLVIIIVVAVHSHHAVTICGQALSF